MLKADGLCHYGPIKQGAETIQLALAMNKLWQRSSLPVAGFRRWH
jgi:hypothetical protein